jgi:HSP20 family molecular chaperone IbpA
LPDGIDPVAAQAAFKNGVLTINIPKAIEGSEVASQLDCTGMRFPPF